MKMRFMTQCVLAMTAFVLFVLTPSDAHAHTGRSTQTGNYETEVTSVEPSLPNVKIKTLSAAERFLLENRSDTDVVVLGYTEEPYLRIGPRGTFQNVSSPACVINERDEYIAPDEQVLNYSLVGPPVFKKMNNNVFTDWHDHRSHLDSNTTPIGASEVGQLDGILQWSFLIQSDNQIHTVTGKTSWLPNKPGWLLAIPVILAVLTALITKKMVFKRLAMLILACFVFLHCLDVPNIPALPNRLASAFGNDILLIVTSLSLLIMSFAHTKFLKKYTSEFFIIMLATFSATIAGLSDLSLLIKPIADSSYSNNQATAIVIGAIGLGSGLAISSIANLKRHLGSGNPKLQSET